MTKRYKLKLGVRIGNNEKKLVPLINGTSTKFVRAEKRDRRNCDRRGIDMEKIFMG